MTQTHVAALPPTERSAGHSAVGARPNGSKLRNGDMQIAVSSEIQSYAQRQPVAAVLGNLYVLKWARENGFPWDADVFTQAVVVSWGL